MTIEGVTLWLDPGDWPSDEDFLRFCRLMGLKVEPNGIGLRAEFGASVRMDGDEVMGIYRDPAGHWIFLLATYRSQRCLLEVLQDAWDREREEAANA